MCRDSKRCGYCATYTGTGSIYRGLQSITFVSENRIGVGGLAWLGRSFVYVYVYVYVYI